MSRRSRREIDLRFYWQPKQTLVYQLLLTSLATHIGFGGARGAAKSHFARQAALCLGLKFPGIRILILRRTFKEVFANCISPMLRQAPHLKDLYRGPGAEGWPVLKLPNGSQIVFGYAEHKLDIFDFQGDEFAFIFVEEATLFNEEELRWLETCNRWPGDHGFIPKIIWTTNPGNVGHDYVKRVMLDEQYEGNENASDFVFVQGYGWDNVEWCRQALKQDGLTTVHYYAWPEKQRFEYFIQRSDYGRKLWALPEQEREAHLFGDWESFVGQFFREFSRRVHVIKPFTIPSYWERFCSFDWGFKNPACMLWHAVSPEGLVITYREMYVTGKTTPWLAQRALELTGDEKIKYRVCDPSCNDSSRGPSIMEVMANNGWAMVEAENDRKSGWARCRQFLAHEVNEGTGAISGPNWQVFETCTNLIRTVPALIHDEHDPEDVDTKGEDHAPDAWRYGLMTRPSPTITPLSEMPHEYREATIRIQHEDNERGRKQSDQYGPLD